jgi:hypothetical protein
MAEGIYFVVRKDFEWAVQAFRFDEFGSQTDHASAWSKHIFPSLSARLLPGVAPAGDLRECSHGFPRGRITARGEMYTVFHGDDWQDLVSPEDILAPFGLEDIRRSRLRWEVDEAERCRVSEKEILRASLQLAEDWSAV